MARKVGIFNLETETSSLPKFNPHAVSLHDEQLLETIHRAAERPANCYLMVLDRTRPNRAAHFLALHYISQPK